MLRSLTRPNLFRGAALASAAFIAKTDVAHTVNIEVLLGSLSGIKIRGS